MKKWRNERRRGERNEEVREKEKVEKMYEKRIIIIRRRTAIKITKTDENQEKTRNTLTFSSLIIQELLQKEWPICRGSLSDSIDRKVR